MGGVPFGGVGGGSGVVGDEGAPRGEPRVVVRDDGPPAPVADVLVRSLGGGDTWGEESDRLH
nr:MAG TPA: hypothetical protein [Caudoviricetes sp.]